MQAFEVVERRAERWASEPSRTVDPSGTLSSAVLSRELPISASVEPSGKLSRPPSIEPELARPHARPSSSNLSGKLLRPSSADPSSKLLLPSSAEPSGEPPMASSDALKGKLPRSSRVEPCCELLRPMSADSSVDLPLSARLMMSSVDLLRAKLPSLPSAGSSASRRGHRTPSREASS